MAPVTGERGMGRDGLEKRLGQRLPAPLSPHRRSPASRSDGTTVGASPSPSGCRVSSTKNIFGPMRILRFQIATRTGRECSGGTDPFRPGRSEVHLFRNGKGIIDFNAEISDGALNLGVAEQ